MELRSIRYFVAVAEELSFTKAAERLHIAQPPLSQQIKHLEEEVGTLLFERTKHSVMLTEAGRNFLAMAYKILQDAETAVLSAREAGRGEIGHLAIAFVASVAYKRLPMIIHSFKRKYPRVEMELCDLTTVEQEQAFNEGRIDVGFLRPPISSKNLDNAVIFRESFVVALPSDHPLAKLESIPISSLAEENITAISHKLARGLFAQTYSIFDRAGIKPRIQQEVSQLSIAIAFASAGLGMAILPSSIEALHHENITYRPIQGFDEQTDVMVAWKHNDTSVITRNFIELTMQESPLP
jgi:DNA-binding transcriptional LysR family regulator